MTTLNNSTTINIELWFIPFDICFLICIILAIIFSLTLLFIIILDKSCHTIPMLLIANSCLCVCTTASIRLGDIVFTLKNDRQQIDYQDSLCIFRTYITDVVCAVMNYSFLLQAIYRYVTAVYPHRFLYQSVRFQILFICITWLIGMAYPLEFLLRDEIVYNINNQICEVAVEFSFSLIYMTFCGYGIPVSLIMLMYFKLVRYVKEMSKRVTPANTLSRAKRELKMIQCIIILMTILIALGVPYTVFLVISFFMDPPKYHFRIAFVFLDASLLFISFALFQFNDPLKMSVMKRIKWRRNVVVAAMA